jgi:5'-3' exonuclease
MEEEGLDPSVLQSEVNLEPEGHAIYNAKSLVATTIELAQADQYRLYLSGPTNFRNDVATTRVYKGNRDAAHKPKHGPAIKEFLQKRYFVDVSVNEEADDVVAYEHYAMWLDDPYETVICSVDKDLDMVPGLHYNFVRDRSYIVTPVEGLRCFYKQLLTGDSTDNIPGLKGIGPKKADAILDELQPTGWLHAVTNAYDSQGGSDYLLEQGQLLWMRRAPNEMWYPGLEWEYYTQETS